jgi:hypothetical protein
MIPLWGSAKTTDIGDTAEIGPGAFYQFLYFFRCHGSILLPQQYHFFEIILKLQDSAVIIILMMYHFIDYVLKDNAVHRGTELEKS